MKKILALAISLLSLSAFADNTIVYQAAGAPKGALRAGLGIDEMETSAATMIPQEIVDRYAGSYITSVQFMSGCMSNNTAANAITDLQAFITNDLFKPGKLTRGRFSKTAQTWTEVKFAEPFLLESGKPVYTGFTCVRPTDNDAPFVYDRAGDPQGQGFWVNFIDADGDRVWENWSEVYGNLLTRVTISGPTVYVADLAVTAVVAPVQVAYGQPFQTNAICKNYGAADITSVTYWVQVGNGQVYTGDYKLPSAVSSQDYITFTFTPACSEYGAEVPVKVRFTKVNGAADPTPDDNYGETSVFCLSESEGFPRVMVLEEGTGTWCGNCPRGLYACEYLTKKYPESFIAIGVHRSDLMEINGGDYSQPGGHDYRVQLSKGLGYPHAFYNRDERYGTSLAYVDQVENIYRDITGLPAVCSIKTEIAFADESRNELSVRHTTEFSLDNTIPYRIATVLVENNVGPYEQQNYYSGVSGVPVGEWAEREGATLAMFNDVARYIDEYHGLEGSVPEIKRSHEQYIYCMRIPTDRLKSLKDFDVIGLLINSRTGVVENAWKAHGSDELPVADLDGIREITFDKPGMATYDLQGRRVAAPTHGIYIQNGRKVRL